MPKRQAKPRERQRLPLSTKTVVLAEAGYRCAVPSCREILALDMHHIWEVAAGGGDDPANLVALCLTCHGLYHRGTISSEAIHLYKSILVAITRAFDIEAIDNLLFLSQLKKDFLIVSGDGLLHFSRIIAVGMAGVTLKANNNDQFVTYSVNLSNKGKQLIEAWKEGDRARVKHVLGGPVPGLDSNGNLPTQAKSQRRKRK
jgi:HNH endonuclease